MSNCWLNAAFDHSGSRGLARLVLLSLCDRAGDEGRCWPSIRNLQRRTGGATERGVAKAIAKLVALGELCVSRGGGRHRTNHYRITLAPKTPNGAQGFRDKKTPNGAPRNPELCDNKPRTARRGNPTEPSRTKNGARAGAPSARVGTVAVQDSGAVVQDPDAEIFERLLTERRADVARLAGALIPRPIATGLARKRAAPRPRRIPAAEQRATYELLRGVPRLADGDARDLSRIGTEAEFRAALALMNGKRPRNPGGWLRAAIMQNWSESGAAEKRTETARHAPRRARAVGSGGESRLDEAARED